MFFVKKIAATALQDCKDLPEDFNTSEWGQSEYFLAILQVQVAPQVSAKTVKDAERRFVVFFCRAGLKSFYIRAGGTKLPSVGHGWPFKGQGSQGTRLEPRFCF